MDLYSTVLKHLGLQLGSQLFLNLVGHGFDKITTRLNQKGANLVVCQTKWTFYPDEVLDSVVDFTPLIQIGSEPLVLYGHKLGIRTGPDQILFPQENISSADLTKIAKMLGGSLELVDGSWEVEVTDKADISVNRLASIVLDTGKVVCNVRRPD